MTRLLLCLCLSLTFGGIALAADSPQALIAAWAESWNKQQVAGLVAQMSETNSMRTGYHGSERGRAAIDQRFQALFATLGSMGEATIVTHDAERELLVVTAAFGKEQPLRMPVTFKVRTSPAGVLQIEELTIGRNLLQVADPAAANAATTALQEAWNSGDVERLILAQHPASALRNTWETLGEERADFKEQYAEIIAQMGTMDTIKIGDFDPRTGFWTLTIRFGKAGDKACMLQVAPWGDRWLPYEFDVRE